MIDPNQPPLSRTVVQYLQPNQYDSYERLNEKTLGQIIDQEDTRSQLSKIVMSVWRLAIGNEDSSTRDYCNKLILYIINRPIRK